MLCLITFKLLFSCVPKRLLTLLFIKNGKVVTFSHSEFKLRISYLSYVTHIEVTCLISELRNSYRSYVSHIGVGCESKKVIFTLLSLVAHHLLRQVMRGSPPVTHGFSMLH